MRVLVYDTHSYDKIHLEEANAGRHHLEFTETQLNLQTAALAQDFESVCLFVNDCANAAVLERLAKGGVRMIAQRSTGFNNIDLRAAAQFGIAVMRVGYYSPYSVAEHAVALLQTLNRKTHRAYNRTREYNFRLAGLLGVDIHGRTVGVVGTGKIGSIFATIMKGFGCHLIGYDVAENQDCLALGMRYVSLEELFANADIISLHAPLTPTTHHLVNTERLALMKHGSFLINTSRGGLVDSEALIECLKAGKLRGVGLDVYEEEEGKFFHDLSDQVMTDDLLARLMTFSNVLITGHQAFFTHEAISTICQTTMQNLSDFEEGRSNANVLK